VPPLACGVPPAIELTCDVFPPVAELVLEPAAALPPKVVSSPPPGEGEDEHPAPTARANATKC